MLILKDNLYIIYPINMTDIVKGSSKVFDIVDLIETNPILKLSKPYQNKLLNKIKNSFETNEQQIFITNFYSYLNYKDDEFVIDLDNVWKWIGYSKKDKAKDILKKIFIYNIDYTIMLPGYREQDHGGHNKEQILMTIDTFKELCMETKTDTGKKIRKYYIKLEKILNETLLEETTELKEEIEKKTKLLESTTYALEVEKKNFLNSVRKTAV